MRSPCPGDNAQAINSSSPRWFVPLSTHITQHLQTPCTWGISPALWPLISFGETSFNFCSASGRKGKALKQKYCLLFAYWQLSGLQQLCFFAHFIELQETFQLETRFG